MGRMSQGFDFPLLSSSLIRYTAVRGKPQASALWEHGAHFIDGQTEASDKKQEQTQFCLAVQTRI